MKVLFVTHYPGFGGANQSCLHLIRMLRERHGVEGIMLTPFAGPVCDEAKKNNIRCDTLRYASWRGPRTGLKRLAFGTLVIIVNAIAVVRAAWRYRHEQIDVVHANSSLAFFGWMYAKFAHKPIVWHLREYGFDDYWMPFYFGNRISGRIYGSSDAVLAISEDIRKFYAGFVRPENRLQTLYNGIDVDLAHANMQLRDDAEKELRGVKVVFIGGINHTKNPYEILPALKCLKDGGQLGDIQFYIIGKGPDEDEAEFNAQVAALGLDCCVHILGFRQNVWPLLSKMDVAVVPSKKEAFGRIAVECMLCGLPVIASNAGALPEIVQDGETGYLFKLGDPTDLADKIRRLAQDAAVRQRLGAAGKQRAEAMFSAQLNADRIYRLYGKILEGGK